MPANRDQKLYTSEGWVHNTGGSYPVEGTRKGFLV